MEATEITTDGLVLVSNVTNCLSVTKLIDEHIMANGSSALALHSCAIMVLGTYSVFTTFVQMKITDNSFICNKIGCIRNVTLPKMTLGLSGHMLVTSVPLCIQYQYVITSVICS